MRYERGFTITEMVIVVVLAGLIVAIATPTVSTAFRRTATRVSADEFTTTHSLARSVAVRYGRLSELHIDAATGKFWVEVDTASAGGVKDTIGVVKNVADHGVTMSVSPSDRDVLCFDVRGIPSTRDSCDPGDAKIMFSRSGKTDTLTITALGRVLR